MAKWSTECAQKQIQNGAQQIFLKEVIFKLDNKIKFEIYLYIKIGLDGSK